MGCPGSAFLAAQRSVTLDAKPASHQTQPLGCGAKWGLGMAVCNNRSCEQDSLQPRGEMVVKGKIES